MDILFLCYDPANFLKYAPSKPLPWNEATAQISLATSFSDENLIGKMGGWRLQWRIVGCWGRRWGGWGCGWVSGVYLDIRGMRLGVGTPPHEDGGGGERRLEKKNTDRICQ